MIIIEEVTIGRMRIMKKVNEGKVYIWKREERRKKRDSIHSVVEVEKRTVCGFCSSVFSGDFSLVLMIGFSLL